MVTGLSPGVQRFDWGKTRWEVWVQERALKIPPRLSLKVFGGYLSAQALLHAARDYLHPRAEIKLDGSKLVARGPDLIAYEGAPGLEVVEENLPALAAEGLILSNWPEKIEQDQVLLEAPLTGVKPWRVMVHHRNLPDQPARWLEVEILQPADSGQLYAISSFLAGPSSDEIFAGHLAARRYFRETSGSRPQGYWMEVAGGRRHLVERAWLKPGQTVSAMLSIRGAFTDRQPGLLRVTARQPDQPTGGLSLKPLEASARTSRGVFPAEIAKTLTYRVGPAYLFEDIGGQPYLRELVDPANRMNGVSGVEGGGSQVCLGNFGAVYRYRLVLENSTQQDQEVRMELSARGGPARACLRLDGESLETDLLKAEPQVIRRWTVGAQSRVEMALETFPQAGSNFPLSMTLSSREIRGQAAPAPRALETNWFIP